LAPTIRAGGEFFTPFSTNRGCSRVPLRHSNADVLRIATINSARDGFSRPTRLIEAGKWADLVIVRGNPVQDIKRVRLPRLVINR
jgi:imidazolonepropionase-like amidohydrolase